MATTGTRAVNINSGDCAYFAEAVLEAMGLEQNDDTFINADPFDGADEFGNDNIFWPGHYWITHHGRHYDLECPDGVDCWHDLPLFKRFIKYKHLTLKRAGQRAAA